MKRYRIISELGKGATGVVYRAVRSKDGSTVALKKLVVPGHLDAREEEDFIRRFKSEAEAALAMDHPGVVKCLDCGLDEGTFYIAYELIEGVTLEDALKSERKFSPEEVADILMQASDALAYAHEQGVVHRDISPGNVFIGDDGKTRIADFGVARFTSKVTLTPGAEAIVGTPGYMAPEQVTGGDPDPRSDIFSLGCVVYELLAGEPPFTGESLAQIIHRVLNVQPPAIRERNPKVPVALEEVVFRMLAKNTDYRYQSMAEVRTAAERVLETIPRAGKVEAEEEAGHAPMLVCVGGPHEGAKFNLQPTVTTIGRTLGDVLLSKDGKVASQHAWITREETGWVLYDADSEDGTLLNRERIEREEILPGDRIQIGETVLEFRGAGGHAGAFAETGDLSEKGELDKTAAVVPGKRVPWALIVLLSLPGIAVVAALVVLGVYFPHSYMSALDEATNERWESAYEKLGAAAIGSREWSQDASDVLAEWSGSPLPGLDQFMAPRWVLGYGRINDEVRYRFALFSLTGEFLVAGTSAAVSESVSTERGVRSSPYGAVRALDPRIEGLEVPVGADAVWEGRKHQLLSLVRRWIAAEVRSDASSPSRTPAGYESERRQAVGQLLNGWYTYREAGSDVTLLEEAFNQFQLCRQTLAPVLQARAGDEDASALRGLASFLAAKVLRDAGSPSRTDRYLRALQTLDEAEADVSGVGQDAWDRAVPRDFIGDFPSPGSVIAQISALRLTLNTLLGISPEEG